MDPSISHSSDFDLHVGDSESHTDAEAALEALRAAIGGTQAAEDYTNPSASIVQDVQDTSLSHQPTPDPELEEQVLGVIPAASSSTSPDATSSLLQQQSLDKLLSSLTQLSNTNMTILDQMNVPSLLQGLAGSLDLLIKSHKKQAEIVSNMRSQIARGGAVTAIDPALTGEYVSRRDYDALKARYDALAGPLAAADTLNDTFGVPELGSPDILPILSQQDTQPTGKKPRAPRQSARATPRSTTLLGGEGEEGGSPVTPGDEKAAGIRKKRSIKLEHLVHKMANRRIGVEYTISGFETKGTKDLPSPESIPPAVADSVNGIDEYRPDFKADTNAMDVKLYIDQVIRDVQEAWPEHKSFDDPEVDEARVKEAVRVYWLRLGKRWEEQQARDRGEVHKDELTRRKQNQYRRQQSLLARRVAAFNTSPLNVCKLRSLYRTLLTIDFAPPTNERPDPFRAYTAEEWQAYQKLANGGRAPTAHEVIDQFWWSSSVRHLLQILDVFSNDQSNRFKRKGKPKQPAPTFHLPKELWDSTVLPIIKPKDHNGLPIAGSTGLVLFRFHVDEEVQKNHPDWAKGLYENPPVPEEDVLLPNLSDVMEASVYTHLKPQVKALRDATTVKRISAEEVKETNERPVQEEPAPRDETPVMDYSQEFMSKSLDSLFAITNNPFAIPNSATTVPHPEASPAGPSLGSSQRARRQAKRLASELPGGAATPVMKRTKKEGVPDIAEQIVEKQVEEGLQGDKTFLEGL